jgi:hypothetical protein
MLPKTAWGQNRKALNEHMSSDFAPRADIVAACRHVRFVPKGDIWVQISESGLDLSTRFLCAFFEGR